MAGLSGDAETVQSEAYVLSSRNLANRVIEILNLAEDAEFNPVLAALSPGPDRFDFPGGRTIESWIQAIMGQAEDGSLSPRWHGSN